MNRRSYFVIASAVLVAVEFTMAVYSAEETSKDGKTHWTAPARAARKENPIAGDPNAIAQGKALFTTACFPCHGPAGKGDGPAADSLERDGVKIRAGNLSDPKMWSQSDGAIFWKITEGNPPMPSFGEALTEEQRWQIVNYIRTLAPPPEAGHHSASSSSK